MFGTNDIQKYPLKGTDNPSQVYMYTSAAGFLFIQKWIGPNM